VHPIENIANVGRIYILLPFSHPLSSAGKILDLSVISVDPARPLPAEGWKVARSRKEERLVGALRDRERQLAQAAQQCECLQQQLQASQSTMEKTNTQLQVTTQCAAHLVSVEYGCLSENRKAGVEISSNPLWVSARPKLSLANLATQPLFSLPNAIHM
jgi:hypothetical protein